MIRKTTFTIAIAILCSFLPRTQNNDTVQLYSLNGFAQGTSYSVKYLHASKSLDSRELDSLFNSVDRSLSLYRNDSKIVAFNKSRSGLIIDSNFREVVNVSLRISKLTDGAFDITSKSLSQLWGFGSEGQPKSSPTINDINGVLKHTGYKHLQLKADSLVKDHESVQIDCDGIAQGYTVDLIAFLLQKKGIKHYLIELGGEIRSSGKKADGSSWQIQLPGPEERVISMPESGLSVTTSGSFSKYKKIGNNYFSHIINPISGRPVNSNIISVSVSASNAASADGLDNAFMVWGIAKTFEYLKTAKDIGVCFLYKNNDGSIADTSNVPFQKLFRISSQLR